MIPKDRVFINNTFAIFLEPLIVYERCARKIKGLRTTATMDVMCSTKYYT